MASSGSLPGVCRHDPCRRLEVSRVVFEFEAVEAEFPEEFPADGSVLLLDVGVVVLSVEARPGHDDVLAPAQCATVQSI